MIYEYVRDKHGHRKGVVCALGRKDIGWSLCCKRDKFDKDFGLMIAQARAVRSRIKKKNIPRVILPYLEKMEGRAKKYYK
jgi:hypothetical protein